MSTPFTLPLHTILDHEGRKIQYQGHLGDNLLSFTDVRSGSPVTVIDPVTGAKGMATRSEEHTSELQSLMRISYAVFCLKKKTTKKKNNPFTPTKHIITK